MIKHTLPASNVSPARTARLQDQSGREAWARPAHAVGLCFNPPRREAETFAVATSAVLPALVCPARKTPRGAHLQRPRHLRCTPPHPPQFELLRSGIAETFRMVLNYYEIIWFEKKLPEQRSCPASTPNHSPECIICQQGGRCFFRMPSDLSYCFVMNAILFGST